MGMSRVAAGNLPPIIAPFGPFTEDHAETDPFPMAGTCTVALKITDNIGGVGETTVHIAIQNRDAVMGGLHSTKRVTFS